VTLGTLPRGHAECLNDYAMARSYVNRLGRFSSPDPLAGDPNNPQSHNRYSYMGNDPVNLTDPLGLWCQNTTYTDSNGTQDWGSLCFDDPFMDMYYPIHVTLAYFMEESPSAIQRPAGNTSGGNTGVPTDKHGVPCDTKILNAINGQFGTQFTTANVNYSRSGTYNGAYNLVVSGSVPTAAEFNALQPGRYSLNPGLGYTLGGGDSLHIPGGGEPIPIANPITGVPTATPTPFQNSNIGGGYSYTFTAHLDNGFPYNPFGFIFHELTDVAGRGSRDPCP
jgi:RHS repeat-associated protein